MRLTTALELVEANTAQGMRELCQLFGQSFGVGARKQFPMVNLPRINMASGDTLNIISPREENNDKISFRYDSFTTQLRITLRYSNSMYCIRFVEVFGGTP